MDALFDSINVRELLLSLHHDFAHLFSLCNDAVSLSRKISDDVVQHRASSLSDRPLIGQIMKQMSATTKEARKKRELVRAILEISENLKAAREAVRNGRLRFAAEQVTKLKKALRVSDRVDESEPAVYSLLRKEWSDSDCSDEIEKNGRGDYLSKDY